MKASKHQSYSSPKPRRYAYPNAADPSYFSQKLLDGISALLTGMGTITLLLYLVTI